MTSQVVFFEDYGNEKILPHSQEVVASGRKNKEVLFFSLHIGV